MVSTGVMIRFRVRVGLGLGLVGFYVYLEVGVTAGCPTSLATSARSKRKRRCEHDTCT